MQSSPIVNDRLVRRPPARLVQSVITDMTRPQCRIEYIRRRAGWPDLQPPSVIRRVRKLVEAHGFPPPINLRFWHGGFLSGARAVCTTAMWDRMSVDRWFDDRMQPGLVLQAENDEVAAHADALDLRAARLVGGR